MFNKIRLKYIFIGLISAFVVVGCSRKKDKFLNKNFHSITTKYNYLYNGNNLLGEALESLNEEETCQRVADSVSHLRGIGCDC